MLEKLEKLQKKLKPKCHAYAEHDKHFGWEVGVRTDQNDYPYWIEFKDSSLSSAVEMLFGFFDGAVPDHSRHDRDPEVFLKTKLTSEELEDFKRKERQAVNHPNPKGESK